jgi:hypothetical protein
MKVARVFTVVLVTLISCQEELTTEEPGLFRTYCGTGDTVNDLAWLRQRTDEFVQAGHSGMDLVVNTVTYNGQQSFEIYICCPACNTLPPEVFNCSGESLGFIGMGIEADELSDRALLWRTENVCNPG